MNNAPFSTTPPPNSLVSINSNGGAYRNGHAYTSDQKWRFITQYLEYVKRGGEVSVRKVAKHLGVSASYARKLMAEVESGEISNPDTQKRSHPTGAGSKTLTFEDELVLLDLRFKNPTLMLKDYRRHLFQMTGSDVSESVLCRWFQTRFPYSARLTKPSIVLRDKFKPENIVRAEEYLRFVSYIMSRNQTHRLKFGDEKHLKGGELFTRKGRRDPLTGEVPNVVADPDFRNTYSIIGLCGIDIRTVPILYGIDYLTNDDSIDFALFIENAIAARFLKPNDILVLDDAAIHIGAENDVMADFLWNVPSPVDGQPMRLYLLLLPPRSPELNPIELIWSQLVTQLRHVNIHAPRPARDAPAYFASEILNGFTHEDVQKCYHHCNYY